MNKEGLITLSIFLGILVAVFVVSTIFLVERTDNSVRNGYIVYEGKLYKVEQVKQLPEG